MNFVLFFFAILVHYSLANATYFSELVSYFVGINGHTLFSNFDAAFPKITS